MNSSGLGNPRSANGTGSGAKEDRVFPIRSILTPAQSGEQLSPASTGDKEPIVWANGKFVRCDQEPIHIPGSIQSYGALIAIRYDTWQVRQVSENTLDILGIDAQAFLSSESLRDFLDDSQIERLQGQLEALSEFPAEAGPEVFPLYFSLKDTQGTSPCTPLKNTLICAAHRFEKNPGLVILEVEDQDDNQFPLAIEEEASSVASGTPVVVSTSKNEKKISLGKVTVAHSFDDMMGVFNIISKISSYLSTKTTVRSLSSELARIIQQITGFDRVLVYEVFDSLN
jgi:light-regulated signal transduction histidine kinase (bacteriophytochrome)